MKKFITIYALILMQQGNAQEGSSFIQKGNEAFKRADYKSAAEQYTQALQSDSANANAIAKFNLGNAMYKQNNMAAAEKYFDAAAVSTSEDASKAKAFYNKGVACIRQKKLLDGIDAFKQSLKLAPDDNDTRENLQKALNELKRQQQQNQKQNNQQKKQNKQPQPRQPDMQMMEQKFNELRNQEKQLQKKLQQKSSGGQQEKDW